jgi:hypothetical protein
MHVHQSILPPGPVGKVRRGPLGNLATHVAAAAPDMCGRGTERLSEIASVPAPSFAGSVATGVTQPLARNVMKGASRGVMLRCVLVRRREAR